MGGRKLTEKQSKKAMVTARGAYGEQDRGSALDTTPASISCFSRASSFGILAFAACAS